MAIGMSGMAKLHTFQGDTALALAFQYVDSKWMSLVIYFSAFFGISACAFTMFMS